jgi:HAD superfamily hydrolase (TIGR01509 family)
VSSLRSPRSLAAIRAVTFDFGNTLVPVNRAGLDEVVRATVGTLATLTRSNAIDLAVVWEEERERQWREDVPAFRETDLAARIVRVLARARGMPMPPSDTPWDDVAAAERSDPGEVASALQVYSRAFAGLPPDPEAEHVLTGLARRGLRLGILSNWPLAASIDLYVEVHGWGRVLDAVIVSERVGTIKPRPEMFRAAERALHVEPAEILHVGDDWAADVVGARQAGWHAAYLRSRPADSPLPSSEPAGEPGADLELDRLSNVLIPFADREPRFAHEGVQVAGDARVRLRTQ